jgi:hypothetical protein
MKPFAKNQGRHRYEAGNLEYPETLQSLQEGGKPAPEAVLAFFRNRGRSHTDWMKSWTREQ